MKDIFDVVWKICVLVVLFLIAFAIQNASAESAIVSFDSPEHLVALTDSVVGVCDTARGEPTYKYMKCHSHKCREVMERNIAEWGGELIHIDGYCDSSEGCLIGYYIYYPIITCRKFVGRTVMPNIKLWEWLMNPSRIRMRPPSWQVIIDYKEVKQ